MSGASFQRRTLLTGLAGAAVLLGSGALSSCAKESLSTPNSGALNRAVKLPTYIQYKGVQPDLPGTRQGVDPAFRNFPSDPPVSVAEIPGQGETISGMANTFYAVAPGLSRNSFWAGLNQRLGVNLTLQMVGNADYVQKFATTIAGNQLPDMLQMQVVARFPVLLNKRFTKLDEYLSGDAIKEYPNLANIPTRSWKSCVYNGGIYGIPIPRGVIGNYNFIRQDLFDAAGVSGQPKSYAELVETGRALTDAKKRRWAYGLISQPRALLGRMNGEPNIWREEGGKLTHVYETDEYRQTITDLIAMWSSGVVHPDAFNSAQPFKQLFNAGTVAVNAADGYVGWTQYISDNVTNPGFKLGLMPVYTRDSGRLADWNLGSGIYALAGAPSMTSLKVQKDPEKIKLILRVLNYLAAPFGTQEYLYRLFGQEGVDHTVVNGNPVLTKTGAANTVLPLRYLADAPYAVFQPGRPQDADVQHAYQALEIPTGIGNPTLGLFSNTAATKNATADSNFGSAISDIIQGRQPLAGLDGLIQAWRGAAGDAMRTEYQDQLQTSK